MKDEVVGFNIKTTFNDIHYMNLTVMVGYRILIAQGVEYLRCVGTSIWPLRQYYTQLAIRLELFKYIRYYKRWRFEPFKNQDW